MVANLVRKLMERDAKNWTTMVKRRLATRPYSLLIYLLISWSGVNVIFAGIHEVERAREGVNDVRHSGGKIWVC